MIQNCNRLKEILNDYKFDYTVALERQKFCAKAFDFFIWMLDGIRYSLTKLGPEITEIQKSVEVLLETLFEFCEKQIYCLLIYVYVNQINSKSECLPFVLVLTAVFSRPRGDFETSGLCR